MFQTLGVIGQIATTFLEGRVAKQKGENQIKLAEAEVKQKFSVLNQIGKELWQVIRHYHGKMNG